MYCIVFDNNIEQKCKVMRRGNVALTFVCRACREEMEIMQEERIASRRDYNALVSELSSVLHVEHETVALKHSVTFYV